MATHRRIFTGGFTQGFFYGEQAFLSDDGLPGVATDSVGKGIEYFSGAVEGFFSHWLTKVTIMLCSPFVIGCGVVEPYDQQACY